MLSFSRNLEFNTYTTNQIRAALLNIIIKSEIARQHTLIMVFLGIVGTEKTSLIDAAIRGVSVDTRERCCIIKLGS